MNRLDKWSILAGVRFFLASVVAINHIIDYAPIGIWAVIPMFGAFEAILGFLLISGYSISESYKKQPQGFLWRRIRRLYPIYLTAIVVSYLVDYIVKAPRADVVFLAENAFFLNQLVTSASFVGPAWSLSLEFWLYCLTPFLVLLSEGKTRLIIFFSFFCFLVYTVLRTTAHYPFFSGVGYGANLILLSFVWVAGLRLARTGDTKRAMRDVGILFSGHIVLDAAIKFGSRYKHHEVGHFFSEDIFAFAMQSFTLIMVYLIFKHLVIPERASLHRSWLLRFLGDVSYPLYLLHAAVFAILKYFGSQSPLLMYLSAVLVSALVYWSLDFYSKKRHQQMGTA